MPPPKRPKQRRRRGRVEIGLDRDLAEHPEIGPGARAHMRAQAQALDDCDLGGLIADARAASEASRVYLELRRAYGLAAAAQPSDPFAELMADLARPGAGASDTTVAG